MPQGIHDVDLDLPLQTIWEFVSEMDFWIPLVPGYISHEIIHDRQSTWMFNGDIGIMKKKISLQVDITEWTPPSQVRFTLTGINENFTGEGYFQAKPLGGQRTNMTGSLEITAKGVKAPVINPVLKTLVPKTTAEMVEAIASRMIESTAAPRMRE